MTAFRKLARPPDGQAEQKDQKITTLLRVVLERLASPSRMLELYYWSCEQDLLHMMRTIVGMDRRPRATIEAFLAFAKDARQISATIDSQGRLIVTSEEIGRDLAAVQTMVEQTLIDPSRTLN